MQKGTHSQASYQALTKFLPMRAVDGTTGGWFVIPVRKWYQDCKILWVTDLKCICGAWKAHKGTKIFVCGTQVSHR